MFKGDVQAIFLTFAQNVVSARNALPEVIVEADMIMTFKECVQSLEAH